jgi:hypothetical protein
MVLIAPACGIDFKGVLYLVSNAAENRQLLFFRPACVSRIIKAPMVPVDLAGKHRTDLVCLSADGDDSLHLPAEEFVEVFGVMAGDINPNLLHNFDCLRVNITGRLGAGALHIKQISSSLSQNTFGHVATAGIARAEDKNDRFGIHKANQLADRKRSASMAAMQPMPAAVTA